MRRTVVLVSINAFVLMLLVSATIVILVLLFDQQAFNHQQTQNGQAELRAVVQKVEKHFDQTIHSSINSAAAKFARQIGH